MIVVFRMIAVTTKIDLQKQTDFTCAILKI